MHQSKQTDFRSCNLRSKLMNYQFEIIYRPWKENLVADALSRNPVIEEGQADPDQP